MSLETRYNLKSPGVKRLMREALELANPTEEYHVCPLEDNLFEWHFTVRGPSETEFEGGYYHGRILLPPQYPMQPPNIILLTIGVLFQPNGRFEVNKKICLSISGFHPETWQPSWSIRTALLALIAFMPSKGAGTIGSLDYTPEERQLLAKKSKSWECPTCGKIADTLVSAEKTPVLTQEENSMLQTITLKTEEDKSEKAPPAEEGDEAETVKSDISQDLRQRNVPSTSQMQTQVVDDILRTSIERSNRDKFWKVIISIIVALIALLVLRRVLFT
ncbi:hypothetical protein YQE_10205, partial [Dendroctonus ponderosae]